VNPAITYGCFERLKAWRLAESGKGKLGVWENFWLGVASKTLATVVTYPYIFVGHTLSHFHQVLAHVYLVGKGPITGQGKYPPWQGGRYDIGKRAPAHLDQYTIKTTIVRRDRLSSCLRLRPYTSILNNRHRVCSTDRSKG
jgi:hypothetical protein